MIRNIVIKIPTCNTDREYSEFMDSKIQEILDENSIQNNVAEKGVVKYPPTVIGVIPLEYIHVLNATIITKVMVTIDI